MGSAFAHRENESIFHLNGAQWCQVRNRLFHLRASSATREVSPARF